MAYTAETAQVRAAQLKEGLAWSQNLMREFNSTLDSYSGHLTDLKMAVAGVAQRTQALRTAQANIKNARDEVEEMLSHLDTARQVESTILTGPHSNLAAFLKSLARLEASTAFLAQHRQVPTADSALSSATALQRDAMRLALDDFVATLKQQAAVPAVPSWGGSPAGSLTPTAGYTPRQGAKLELDEDEVPVVIPPSVAAHLRALADVLLRNGESGAFKAYVEVRRGVVEKALAGLLNAASAGEEQKGALVSRISEWVAALKLLVGILRAEHKAALSVWPSEYTAAEPAFNEVVSRSVVAATHAGAFIVTSKRMPEKVFGLLDMQEQVEAALGNMARTLESTSASSILADFTQLAAMIRQEARATLEEFEASITRDSVKHPPPDGTVHPLAAYTLSFLKRLFGFEATIDTLFSDEENEAAALAAARRGEAVARRQQEGVNEAAADAVRGAVGHMLHVLMDNLETKSRTYKNKALAALFLMNNVHYIVKAVESSEALSVVGQDWIERHKDLIEQYGEEYQEISWGNLMSLVGDGVNGEGKAWAKERAGIKERWREVNAAITELRDTQCSWTIPDASLRANMKDAIAEDFVPLYKMFMERYNPDAAAFTKNPEKYVKFSVQDVARLIMGDLFEAKEKESVTVAKGGATQQPWHISEAPSLSSSIQ